MTSINTEAKNGLVINQVNISNSMQIIIEIILYFWKSDKMITTAGCLKESLSIYGRYCLVQSGIIYYKRGIYQII